MEPLLHLHPSGVWLRREALAHGYRDKDLAAARRAKVIVRVRHGAYVSAETWAAADSVERHLLKADAVLLTHGHRAVALSHTTGAAAHGLRLYDPDLSKVHVTQLKGGVGGIAPDVVYHVGKVDPNQLVTKSDRLVVPPTLAALETAAINNVEKGLVVLDSLIDLKLDDLDGLRSGYRNIKRWPDTGKLQITVRLVREGAQSVGESRGRFLCWSQHLPEPELQFEVYDAHGELIGIVDFAWPDHRLLGEFDGRIKYGRLLRPGQEPGDAVFAEKHREDQLREATDFRMIRFIWRDYEIPQVTGGRLRRKLGLAA